MSWQWEAAYLGELRCPQNFVIRHVLQMCKSFGEQERGVGAGFFESTFYLYVRSQSYLALVNTSNQVRIDLLWGHIFSFTKIVDRIKFSLFSFQVQILDFSRCNACIDLTSLYSLLFPVCNSSCISLVVNYPGQYSDHHFSLYPQRHKKLDIAG